MKSLSIHQYECGFQKDNMRRCALLRMERDDGIGYADLAPFLSLGDPCLEELFFSKHKLWRRALFFARHPLNTWKCTPLASHAFFSSFKEAKKAFQNGFQKVSKIKCLQEDGSCWVDQLLEIRCLLAKKQLRIDCNESYSYSSFLPLVSKLKSLAPYIEYIEDPFPYQAELWKEVSQNISVPFAKDHLVEDAIGDIKAAPYLIIKPAKQGWGVIKRAQKAGHKLIFSSYLGHPLERKQSLWMASYYQKVFSCPSYLQGLGDPADFLVYNKKIDLFNEDQLEKLSWKALVC